MKNRNEPTPGVDNSDASHLSKLMDVSDSILIKKLSNNDRDWAYNPDKHQAGPYIPRKQRDGGFFKRLKPKERGDDNKDPILESFFDTIWPQLDGIKKESRLVNYTSKGPETHLTRLPKQLFAHLLPASYFIMGQIKSGNKFAYVCMTIDSGSDEALFLRGRFNLSADFEIDEFNLKEVKQAEQDQILGFCDQAINAWLKGKIEHFARPYKTMPSPGELARMAQEAFLLQNGLTKLDPFALEAPGDVLMEISRTIELKIFEEYQHRVRSLELVRKILGDKAYKITAKDIIRLLIDKFHDIDSLMLSASQQRRSRAGLSYEHHIKTVLTGGKIPFQTQVKTESKKRHDFVIPSIKFLNSDTKEINSGLILSAKTTLRERWKQVESEKKHHRLFLTTVDDNIAGNTINDMASVGINLVVPEKLLISESTEYNNHENVISFKQFCEVHLKPHIKTRKTAIK